MQVGIRSAKAKCAAYDRMQSDLHRRGRRRIRDASDDLVDPSISPDLHERDRRADESLFQRFPRREREHSR